MNKIIFDNVIPHVFANNVQLKSEIWGKHTTFSKGKTYLVEAASGMGKSTFCSYVIGYRHDYSGVLCFDGEDTKLYNSTRWTDIRKHHISHLFQELRLFPELTAWENVKIKNNLTNFSTSNVVDSWFERLGIADKKNSLIGEMSFGQQQRVALMRALVQPFDFILLDEPISHLDDANGKIVGQIVMEEAAKQGAGIIMTSIGKHIDLNYDKVVRL